MLQESSVSDRRGIQRLRLTRNHGVVTFIRLQGYLLESLELILLQCLDLVGEDDVWRRCRVDTAGFYGDDGVAAVFKEGLSVEDDDTGLIGLGNIGEDNVDL